MTKSYKPRPIPNYGELMTVDCFKSLCECGAYTNYDGSGEYVKDGMMFASAIPSEVTQGIVNREATHVIWFNK